jgi:hypothetical protein
MTSALLGGLFGLVVGLMAKKPFSYAVAGFIGGAIGGKLASLPTLAKIGKDPASFLGATALIVAWEIISCLAYRPR